MKSKIFAAISAAALLCASQSCDDTVSTIGSSLTGQNVEIIVDSAYTVAGHPVIVDRISPRVSSQILGRIEIPGYGVLESNVVAQFLPSTQLDTAQFTAENMDSISLIMQYNRGAFIGDSVAPLAMTIYPLDKLLPTTLDSSFDPEGYYSHTPLATKVYNTSTFYGTAEEKAASYRNIRVKLPLELGKRLFNDFVANPSDYANGQTFARNVFPGIYIANTFGSGRMTTFTLCAITVNMRKVYLPEGEEELDTITAEQMYYLVTPEVKNNNNITYKMDPAIKDRILAGDNIIAAPAGSELEFKFPTKEIITKYRTSTDNLAVINGLSFDIPADTIATGYGVTPPPYLLMVLKKDRDEFFAKNKLADNITSFYAAYNASTQSYSFSNMRPYITEMLSRDNIGDDDCTFSLVPVQVNFESTANTSYYYDTSSQVESEIYPYIAGPAMAEIKFDDAQIKFIYSLQTQK